MANEKHKKIALAVWGNIMSPVFDSARLALIVEIRNGEVIDSHYKELGLELPYSRALRLSEWGVQVLICGAISAGYSRTIELYDIDVISFISGDVDKVLVAYLNGTLTADAFYMPGFGRGRRRRYRGGRR